MEYLIHEKKNDVINDFHFNHKMEGSITFEEVGRMKIDVNLKTYLK